MKKLLTVIFASLFIIAGCAKNANGKVIKVATDATWPPMEFVENKAIVGFDIDLINAIAKETGIKIEITNSAWDGIFTSLNAGEYDAVISSVTITDERKKSMDFSDPYINAGQIMIVKKGTDATTINDFIGKQAGAQIGTTGAMEIDKVKGLKKKTYDEIGLAVEDLANGRIDVVITDTPTAASFVLRNPKFKETLKLAGTPFTQEFYGIAVKKGNKELLDTLNKGIAKVKQSGELKKLEEKWLR